MISNIPRKRCDERFTVYLEKVPQTGTQWYSVQNSGNWKITEFDITDTYALEALLQAVLESGIKQGKEEVRLALGMKE
jgi:hypothetical protein